MRQKTKDYGDAHDQGRTIIQSRAHHDSLGPNKNMPRGAGSGRRQEKRNCFAAGPEKKPERFVSTSSFLILDYDDGVQQCCCRHPNDIPRWAFAPTAACLQPCVVINQEFNNVHVLAFCDFRANAASLIEAILPESDWFSGAGAGRSVQAGREPARTKPRQ